MNGEVDAFFISTRRRRGLRFAVIGMPIVVVWHLVGMTLELLGKGSGVSWLIWAIAAILFGCVWVYYARRLGQVKRPILEVSDQAIRWGTPSSSSFARPELRMEEVRSVSWKKPGELELLMETRSGRRVAIDVSDIEPGERDRVYDAIRTRLAGSPG